MSELEKISVENDKHSWQKKYNITSKNLANMLGQNISLLICILLPVLLVGFIWTDFGMPKIGFGLLSDGIVTIVLFFIGELMMMRVGADGGKLDPEYIAIKKEHASLVDQVNQIGTTLMGMFCEWQIDVEYEKAITSRLRALKLTKKDWEAIKHDHKNDLFDIYGKHKALQIRSIQRLKPIELNEAILMYQGADDLNNTRGGVPISGEDFMRKQSYSVTKILAMLFTGLLTVSVAITLTQDISFSRVMYTAFKLIVLLSRMAQGYATGAKAYNTVEVRQLQSKAGYLRQYIRFVNEKQYLAIEDKYKED
jgi:hypothetical protein